MAEKIIEMVQFMPPEVRVFFLSMLPITELRVAIPLGIALGIDPLKNYLYATAGNLVPVLPILLLLRPAIRLFSRWEPLGRIIRKVLASAEAKKCQYEKYELLGLTLFVSIPAPGTGAWTGTLIAYLLQLSVLRAFVSIAAGVFIVGGLMTLISLGAVSLLANRLAGGVLVVVLFAAMVVVSRRRKCPVPAEPEETPEIKGNVNDV